MDDLIICYFNLGLDQTEILQHLKTTHNVNISLRTLQRRLQNLGLYRRKFYTDINHVYDFIIHELQGSGACHGIKWMHLKCKLNNLVVPRNVVAEIMHIVDPDGMHARSRRRLRRRVYQAHGPNWIWHTDGYDKLKRYGICVQGCIDGYSRLIIWLRAGSTNNDPFIVAGYFIEAVEQLGAIPITVRSDRGTENVHIRSIQTNLRSAHFESGRPPFLTGRSTNNQRIESWWSILRRENAQYYMDLFKSLDEDGFFSGSYLDKNLVRFFFLPLIQEELNEVARIWNCHIIRRSKHATAPSGKPINLYFTPEVFNTRDFSVTVHDNEVTAWKRTCRFEQIPCCDENINILCNDILQRRNLQQHGTVEDAIENYKIVRTEIIDHFGEYE